MTVGSRQLPVPHSVALAHPPSPTCSPLLTWRDMQHLVVRASRPAQLQAEDWRTNGAGRRGVAGPNGGGGLGGVGPPHAQGHDRRPLPLQ